MINRSIINHLLEDLLCAGILLSLCAVIILGPQRGSNEQGRSEPSSRAGTSAVEESRLSNSLTTIHQASTKSPNP